MARLTDSELIRRYLYLGTDQPFYIRENRPLNIAEGRRILEPVDIHDRADERTVDEETQRLAGAVTLEVAPMDVLREVWKSSSLVRHDECLFTMAYLARTYRADTKKHTVYDAVPGLIETSEDLFQFVDFYLRLAKDDPRGKGCGFGNGMKVALRRWYDKHTAEQLAVLLASDRGSLKWSHKHLLVMLHLNLANEDKMQVIDAAVGGVGRKRPPKPKKQKAPKRPRNNVAGEGLAPAPEQPSVPEQPLMPEQPPVPEVPPAPVQQPSDEDSAALLVYRRYKAVKAANTLPSVLTLLSGFQYPMHLVSAQLQRAAEVWLAMLPNMLYRELVQVALVMQDYKLLKDFDSPLSLAYSNTLNSMTAVRTSKISPIFIFQIMRLFEEKQRYLNVVKEAVHTANNLALKGMTPNPLIMKTLNKALDESLMNCKRTGTGAC